MHIKKTVVSLGFINIPMLVWKQKVRVRSITKLKRVSGIFSPTKYYDLRTMHEMMMMHR